MHTILVLTHEPQNPLCMRRPLNVNAYMLIWFPGVIDVACNKSRIIKIVLNSLVSSLISDLQAITT